MSPINFLLGSKTYRRKAKRASLARRQLIIPLLTNTYALPTGGTAGVLSALSEQGHTRLPSPSGIYHDKDICRQAYLYLNEDEQYRKGIDDRLLRRGEIPVLFGVACLKADNVTTWEQAVRLAEEWMESEASRAPGKPSPAVKPEAATVAQVPLRVRHEPAVSEPAEPEQMLAAALDKIREALEAIVASAARRIQQQERRIAALEAAWPRNLKVQTAAVEIMAERIEAQHLILEGFPEWTVPKEKGGSWWEQELSFEIEAEFGKFLKTVHNTGAESQLIKAVQIVGLFGPWHGSLQTKKLSRSLRGIPKDMKWYYYSRAADDIRFTWVTEQEKIRLLAAYSKQEVE